MRAVEKILCRPPMHGTQRTYRPSKAKWVFLRNRKYFSRFSIFVAIATLSDVRQLLTREIGDTFGEPTEFFSFFFLLFSSFFFLLFQFFFRHTSCWTHENVDVRDGCEIPAPDELYQFAQCRPFHNSRIPASSSRLKIDAKKTISQTADGAVRSHGRPCPPGENLFLEMDARGGTVPV